MLKKKTFVKLNGIVVHKMLMYEKLTSGENMQQYFLQMIELAGRLHTETEAFYT